MKNKLINLLILIFTLCCSVFAQTNIEKEPSKIKEIESAETKVVFKTDVLNAQVYINEVFYGWTNLEVTDLVAGLYTVKLVKDGYENQEFQIYVRNGFELTYSTELELTTATITVLNIQENSEFYLDNIKQEFDSAKLLSKILIVTPGVHKISVKKFGYKNFEAVVEPEAHQQLEISVEMEKSIPEVKGFSATKKIFNPDYNGPLGCCTFNFSVTADFPVQIKIYDENLDMVWSSDLDNFTTWNQSFMWNGKSSSGTALQNGDYKVVLSDGQVALEEIVTINSKVDYPLFSFTAGGAGIGSVPVAFVNPQNYYAASISFAPVGQFKDSVGSFYGLDMAAGFLWAFRNHFELGGMLTTMPGLKDGFMGRMNVNFKAYDSKKIKDHLILNYGGLVRCGVANREILYPYGVDNGSGLGAGAMVSLTYESLTAGFTSQFIYSAKNGHLADITSVWKNSFTVSFRPVKSLNLSSWCGINSSINVPEEQKSFILVRGFDCGVGLNVLPFSSTIMFDAKFMAVFIPGHENYISGRFGLSYLF